MSGVPSPHPGFAEARLALGMLSRGQHLNGDHPAVVLGDALDGIEEQHDFAQQALAAEGEYRATAEATIKSLEEQHTALRKAVEDHLDVCSRAAGVQAPLREALGD